MGLHLTHTRMQQRSVRTALVCASASLSHTQQRSVVRSRTYTLACVRPSTSLSPSLSHTHATAARTTYALLLSLHVWVESPRCTVVPPPLYQFGFYLQICVRTRN